MMTVAREWLRDENARMASSGEAADPRHVTRIVGWLLAEVQRLRLRVCDRISHLGEEEYSPTLTAQERFVLREVRDIYANEDDSACNEIAAVIDGLLERTK